LAWAMDQHDRRVRECLNNAGLDEPSVWPGGGVV
jgi:hypothetical protein